MTAKSRRRWRWWLVVPGATLGLALAGVAALPWLLVAPAQPGKAEVIVHLALDPHSHADFYVARLYEQGLAGTIVCVSSQIACEVYAADHAARHLVALGVPEADVLTLHLPQRECGAANLPRLVEYVQAHGWQNVLLVVNPVGSRPATWLASRYFGRAGIDLAMTYSPRDRRSFLHQWWHTHAKAQRMVTAALQAGLDLLYPQCW